MAVIEEAVEDGGWRPPEENLILKRAALRDIAMALTHEQARPLVDYYYRVQDFRIRAAGQERAVIQTVDDAPTHLIEHVTASMGLLEGDIRVGLGAYAAAHRPGRWAMSITGIGPVLAAGLLAHIDIRRAPTVGHIWRFAGLDPSNVWLGKDKAAALIADLAAEVEDPDDVLQLIAAASLKTTRNYQSLLRMAVPRGKTEPTRKGLEAALAKRPWNADLKALCWKIGDSFVKQKGRESDTYGKVYAERKALYVATNQAGGYAETAAETLATRQIRDPETRKTYEAGRLPDGRIDLRARRKAVKLFLAHFHHVSYECEFHKPPPKPFIIDNRGHADYIAPPNWPDIA